MNLNDYHNKSRRGQAIDLWDVEFVDFIVDWNDRHNKVLTGTPVTDPFKHPKSYFNWYLNEFHPFVLRGHHTLDSPSTSAREFTPGPTPMQTTTQNQSAPYGFYTPHQFQIPDSQTYSSPTTTNFNNQHNFYPTPPQMYNNQQNFHQPPPLNFNLNLPTPQDETNFNLNQPATQDDPFSNEWDADLLNTDFTPQQLQDISFFEFRYILLEIYI
jgi:hypothetical protein